jgi:hypothetical protein
MWNAKASCSRTKDEADEVEAGVEIFRTTRSPSRVRNTEYTMYFWIPEGSSRAIYCER